MSAGELQAELMLYIMSAGQCTIWEIYKYHSRHNGHRRLVTTIQVDEETRKRLFDLITQIQAKTGRRVTYDEALRIVLGRSDRTRAARRKFSEYFGSLKGAPGVWEELSTLKRTERERLESKSH